MKKMVLIYEIYMELGRKLMWGQWAQFVLELEFQAYLVWLQELITKGFGCPFINFLELFEMTDLGLILSYLFGILVRYTLCPYIRSQVLLWHVLCMKLVLMVFQNIDEHVDHMYIYCNKICYSNRERVENNLFNQLELRLVMNFHSIFSCERLIINIYWLRIHSLFFQLSAIFQISYPNLRFHPQFFNETLIYTNPKFYPPQNIAFNLMST